MEFKPTEYVRKPFNVLAEEVSYNNIEALAEWCKGRVDSETTRVLGNEVKLPVIKFPGQAEDRGKELVARLGCFIVYSKNRFRVYKGAQFHAAFRKLELEQVAGQTYEPKVDDADFCIDHNTTLSVCGEEHMTDQPAEAANA